MRINPMLAQKFDESRMDFDNSKVFIQPKLDGVRCIFTKDGAYSRANNKFMNINHIEKKLEEFFKNNPDIILDGELYNHKLKNDFEKIISLVRKQKPTTKDKEEASKLVQYHVYDIIPRLPSENQLYEKRLMKIKGIFKLFSKEELKTLKMVDTYLCENKEIADKYHKKFLDKGFEGSILRKNGLYKKKRAWELQKFKDFHDTEALIIGYEIGKGKRKGTLGKFLMQDDEGVKFGCPPGKGYTYKDMKDMLDNIDDYIGQRATFTYFQRTKAGSYRHPLFKGLRNYE